MSEIENSRFEKANKKIPVLEVEDLSIRYGETEALNSLSFSLMQSSSLGIIGESGSGKTSSLMSIMGLISHENIRNGKVVYGGKDLLKLNKRELDKIRWNEISIVFQNSSKYLNPSFSIEKQIVEVMDAELKKDKHAAKRRLDELFDYFDLDRNFQKAFPSQLSGGMVQRVLIIMALASNPKLLLVDEPTTALDSNSKRLLIDILIKLRSDTDISMIVVSHDLSVIKALTDESIVLYKGDAVEINKTAEIIANPRHPYTKAMVMSSVEINPYKDLWGISRLSDEESTGCKFYNSCTQRISCCKSKKLKALKGYGVSCHRGGIVKLAKIKNLQKTYKLKGQSIDACKNINFDIEHGEVIGVIGESGSGKTTLGMMISGLISPSSGQIVLNEDEISYKNSLATLGGIQVVMQDPHEAINQKFTVKETILEPIVIGSIYEKSQHDSIVKNALDDVGLYAMSPDKNVSKLSGGELQRVSIARALVMKPKLLVADEISSQLDISSKVNLLRLLKGLQHYKGFSLIFITHELRLAQKIANRIIVMHKGKIVEMGLSQDVFLNPKADYTKSLFQNMG